MTATITDTELQTLGDHLELLLQEHNISIGVRCGFEQECLIIVGCHSPDTALDPLQVLRSLQSLVLSFRLAFTRRVRLYLRVMGRSLPYARCHFLLDESSDFPQVEETGVVQMGAWLEGTVSDWLGSPQFEPCDRSELVGPDIHPVDWVAIHQSRRWNWVAGVENYLAVTAVFGMGLSGYLMSQPCIAGSCPELQTAQALKQESQKILDTAEDTDDLQEAQEYLVGAVGLLETIPRWSQRSPEAQTLVADYRQQLTWVEQATAAAELAASAQDKSDYFTSQLESWATIQLLWQEAIDKLAAIPEDSPLHGFAERKLANYRTYLTFAQEQRALEEKGQEELFVARQEIRQAQNKHAKAVTVTDWQMVWTTWNTAMNRLQTIAPDTQAGVEAQRLLMAYGDIPRELGDRLQIGIIETPPPPERSYQTPINWSDVNTKIDIPPPPLVLR